MREQYTDKETGRRHIWGEASGSRGSTSTLSSFGFHVIETMSVRRSISEGSACQPGSGTLLSGARLKRLRPLYEPLLNLEWGSPLSWEAVDLLFSSLNARGKYLRSVVEIGCGGRLERWCLLTEWKKARRFTKTEISVNDETHCAR